MTSILMVTKYFPPVSYGGTEKYVEVISQKLSEKGLTVTILAPSKDKNITYEQNGPILICRAPLHKLKYLEFSIPMKKCLKSLSFDIAHFNTFDTLCRFLRPALKKPYVITTHGFFWKKPTVGNPLNYLFKIKIVKDNFLNSNKIFCVSKKDYENVSSMFGYTPNNLYYMPNGVDPQKFQKQNKATIKAKYRFENRLIITQVGRFSPQKGQHILLKALQIMPKTTRDKYVTILTGYPFDHNYLLNLQQTIKNAKLDKHVLLWPKISDELLFDLYAMTDIFVLPSLTEGLPLTLLEAWASKCAVVVTNVGGLPYVVNDQVDGFIVPPNNSVILSQKITDLIINDEKRKRFSEKGFERAKNEFNLDNNIEFLVQKYREVIEA